MTRLQDVNDRRLKATHEYKWLQADVAAVCAFFPAAVFVTETSGEKKKANIKIHLLKVKQFKWVYSFFRMNKYYGIMKKRETTRLGISNQKMQHTALLKKGDDCSATTQKPTATKATRSPEGTTSPRRSRAVNECTRETASVTRAVGVLSPVSPIMGDSMKLQVLLCGT